MKHFCLFLFFFLFASFGLKASGNIFSFEEFLLQENQVEQKLSTKEWKKFKHFESRLDSTALSQQQKDFKLTQYAKDSIQILKVKLVAIQVLDERNLLQRDIVENRDYYVTLLEKLRESEIPPNEYLFLEEKLAYLERPILEERLSWSAGLNIGLGVMVLSLIAFLIYLKRERPKNHLAQLSKQESLVRNLMLQGKSNKEIANELFVSLSTVKSHITSIYSKLNVANRHELLENGTGAST